LLTLTGYQILDLFTNDGDFFAEAVLWKAPGILNSNKIIFCDVYYLGGTTLFPSTNSYIRRIYPNLPPHASIRFYISIKLVDIWTTGDNIDLNLDSLNVGFQTTMADMTAWATNTPGCRNPDHDLDIIIFGKAQHSALSLTVEIVNKRVSSSNTGTFYFREVSFIFSNETLPVPIQKSIYSLATGINTVNETSCKTMPYSAEQRHCKNCFPTHCNTYHELRYTTYCFNKYFDIEVTNCTNIGSCSTVYSTTPTTYDYCGQDFTGTPVPANFSNDCYTVTFTGTHIPTPKCSTTMTDYTTIISYPDQFPRDCTKGQYYDTTTSTCIDCHNSCDFCSGQNDIDCYNCKATYWWDGTKCIQCAAGCAVCHGPLITDCDLCTPPAYLLDNSCISCDPPLIRSITDTGKFAYCTYPCQLNEYLYDDGTCHPTCNSLFLSITQYGRNFCKFPCTPPNIMFYDGCGPAPCSFPLVIKYDGALEICVFPCALGETLYYNNTCLPTPCSYPLVLENIISHGVHQICEPKCKGLTPYRHNNDTCMATCSPPLRPMVLESAILCGPPMCGAVICDSCSTAPCKEAYGCNIELGRFCIPYYTYGLEPTNMKPVLNGQVITVQVIPTQHGLTADSNDYLLFSIEGLQPHIDYEYDVLHLAVGVFQVNFTLLQPQDGVALYGALHYSPYNIDIRGRFEIPRVTFISEMIQKAGKSVGNASQIAFMLFIISIIAMILGGGLTSLWTSLPDSQYTYYLIYLNIEYLHHTQTYFETLSSYDLLSSPERDPIIIEDLPLKKSLPNKFYALSFPKDFLENSSQIFLQIIVMAIALFCSYFLQRYIRFPRQLSFLHRVLDYAEGALKWNGLIRQGMTYILPLSTASFIQLYSSIFGKSTQTFSLILAGAFLFILLWFFATMYNFIRYVPSTKLERALHTKTYGTLWENLHTNTYGRYYFWFVALRGFLLSYAVVFLTEFPYVQIITLLAYQVLMVGLFMKGIKVRQIFQDNWLNNVTFIEELLILTIKTVILTFMIMKDRGAPDDTLILIGWLIIIPGALSQALHIIYSIAVQVRNRKKHYDAIKLMFLRFGNKKRMRRIRRIARKPKRILKIENRVDEDEL